MRRLRWLGFVLSVCAFAQEAGGQAQDPGDPWLMWKWVNFAILAAGLGYLIVKNAGPFFSSRTASIQKGIAEAAKLKQEAEAKAAEMERKMARLGEAIEQLRATAKSEMAAEGRRIEQETAGALNRIQLQSSQEIEATGKKAAEELRSYAAKLALDLAEQQVRSGMSTEVDHGLVDAFLHDLNARQSGGELR